jgi:hypothetical protein
MSFDWKGTIGKFAPTVATMLGTPLAGTVVSGLCSILGLEPTPENAQKTVEAFAAGQLTGDQLLKLKQLEADTQVKMQELGFKQISDLEKLAVDDRISAREREMKVQDKTPSIGFYVITAGFFGLLACMLFKVIPGGNERVLDVMIGSLGTAWVASCNYYYGTTRSSNEKNQMLFNSQPVK